MPELWLKNLWIGEDWAKQHKGGLRSRWEVPSDHTINITSKDTNIMNNKTQQPARFCGRGAKERICNGQWAMAKIKNQKSNHGE
jgi:hypothetical protein